MSNRTERFSTVSVPVMIIPSPAPLPEVEEWIDAAYQKKHDRPPARTVRLDDADGSAPHYHEGEAGPSISQNGAPPPFEERDAPPPFFFQASEASTSSRLPTFLESETQIFIPTDVEDAMASPPQAQSIIQWEGIRFGFPPSQQFDGHSEEMQRSSTPPPTLEMATRDTNVTNLADLSEPQRAMEALAIALDEQEEVARGELPPPPPPMDDPSDPPPSIDSDFRSPDLHLRHSPPPHSSSPPPHHPSPTYNASTEQVNSLRSSSPAQPTGQQNSSSHGLHAPPPYLIPGNGADQEHVTRPPPYMDLMPPTCD